MRTPWNMFKRRLRNIVISGTNFWNPGDDFVRDGVVRILQERFQGCELNFFFYNFNADYFPQSKFSGIANVVQEGDLDALAPFVDLIVIAGLSAGGEIEDLYRWILRNRLENRVYLIGGGYENAYAARHLVEEPAATIFRRARIIMGRTRERPPQMDAWGLPYYHLPCPALLSAGEVKRDVSERIRRVGFSIQLPEGQGIVNHVCAPAIHALAMELLARLMLSCEIRIIAHHKSEWIFFLKWLHHMGRQDIPVVFSSFYQDLRGAYEGCDALITTRLHSGLFSNSLGMPAVIVNDSARHHCCLEAIPLSRAVSSREAFGQEWQRLRRLNLRSFAEEARVFKAGLLRRYLNLLEVHMDPLHGAEALGAEAGEMRLMQHVVREGDVALDVGAHVGKYARRMSFCVGAGGKVHAFEPNEQSFQKLRAALDCGEHQNVETHRMAMGDHVGTAILHEFAEPYSSWSGLGTPDMKDPEQPERTVAPARAIEVPLGTLDDFCARHGIQQVGYLKLDAEGSEGHILQGAASLLRKKAAKFIQFEISQKMLEGLGVDGRQVFEKLSAAGYFCREMGGDGKLGKVVTASDAFYANYLAWPKSLDEDLPVHFFTIVLNGEPFIRHHLEEFRKLSFRWHWHVIEGVAELKHDTAWSLGQGGRIDPSQHREGRSMDGTSAYLEALAKEFPGQITLYRKRPGVLWEGKLEMVNAPLANLREECLLWQVDADELWTAGQMEAARALFIEDPSRSAARYHCHYFVGKHLVVATRNTYGNRGGEWLRTWRFRPGDRWQSHEPPRLMRRCRGGELDVGELNPFQQAETEAQGLVFQHYAYALESQLRHKESYYGYRDAVKQWKRLQEVRSTPIVLGAYLDWVQDGARAEMVSVLGIQPLLFKEETRELCDREAGAPMMEGGPSYPVMECGNGVASPARTGKEPWIIVRSDTYGDLILFLPVLQAMCAEEPDRPVYLVMREGYADFHVFFPANVRVITTSINPHRQRPSACVEERRALRAALVGLRPGKVIAAAFNRTWLDVWVCSLFPGAERVCLGNAPLPDSCLNEAGLEYAQLEKMFGAVIPVEMQQHECEMNERLIRHLLPESCLSQPALNIPHDLRLAAKTLLKEWNLSDQRWIACCPAGTATVVIKSWPAERYAEILAWLKREQGFEILLLGHEAEETCLKKVQEACRTLGVESRLWLGRDGEFPKLCALLAESALYLGNDSGPMHAAAALDLPTVAVFGGGHWPRFRPAGRRAVSVVCPLPCFGCQWDCIFQNTPCAPCVKAISVEEVKRAVSHALKKGAETFQEEWIARFPPAEMKALFQGVFQPGIGLETNALEKRCEAAVQRADDLAKQVALREFQCHALKEKLARVTARGVASLEGSGGGGHGDAPSRSISKANQLRVAGDSSIETIGCPFCESRRATRVRNSADIVCCDDCHVVYLRTRPKKEVMEKLYQTYADEGSHMALPKSVTEADHSGLKRDYFLKEILQFSEPGGRLLDIGCGWGAFLLNARQHGFEPSGLEITRKAAAYANEALHLPVKTSQFLETEHAPETQSVVTMLHVFEHLPYPKPALEKVFQVLKPGGMFCGIVPNFNSFCSQTLGEAWYWLDPNYHYVHYTPETLRRQLEAAGFIIERIDTHTGDYGSDPIKKLIVAGDPGCAAPALFAERLKRIEAEGRGEEIRFFARKPGTSAPPESVEIIGGVTLSEPLVSVIVSAFNSERFMGPCLENLTRQTLFSQSEVIVVDSGSEQGERAVVTEFQRKHPNIRYVRTPRETLYAAWNRGLELARGRYWANANTDDALRDDALEILFKAMEAHPAARLGYADCVWTSQPNDRFPSQHLIKEVRYPHYEPIHTLFYCLTGCLQFWRTASLRAMGGFDGSLRYAGDYEATVRLAQDGGVAVHVPDFLSLFYQNREGLTQQSRKSSDEHEAIAQRHHESLEIGKIFECRSGSTLEAARAWTALGAWALNISVPWERQRFVRGALALKCFQKAFEIEPECPEVCLNHLHGLTQSGHGDRVRQFDDSDSAAMQEALSRFRAGASIEIPHVRPAVVGPCFDAARAMPSVLAKEPAAFRPWISRRDGKFTFLSSRLIPRPKGTRYLGKELQRMTADLIKVLSRLPPFHAHFGGAGDALLLLSTFYDQHPGRIILSYPTSLASARAFFAAFPDLGQVYFLPVVEDPQIQASLRYIMRSLPNCLGAGTTPKSGYHEEWKPGLDLEKTYQVNKSPRWAAAYRQNHGSRRVGLAPQGSAINMVGSKKNMIDPRLWSSMIQHLLDRGYEPVILGLPEEAKDYPMIKGCLDRRSHSFQQQMEEIGRCAALVGADSWGKTFSALVGIPTFVFEPLKGADLAGWKDASDWVFIKPWPAIKLVNSLAAFQKEFDRRMKALPKVDPAPSLAMSAPLPVSQDLRLPAAVP